MRLLTRASRLQSTERTDDCALVSHKYFHKHETLRERELEPNCAQEKVHWQSFILTGKGGQHCLDCY